MINIDIQQEEHEMKIDKRKGQKRTTEQRERIAAGKKASWQRIHEALKMYETATAQQQQQKLEV